MPRLRRIGIMNSVQRYEWRKFWGGKRNILEEDAEAIRLDPMQCNKFYQQGMKHKSK